MEGDQEMCNFAFFFYEADGKTVRKPTCESVGPPAYSWSSDPMLGKRVPADVDVAASSLA